MSSKIIICYDWYDLSLNIYINKEYKTHRILIEILELMINLTEQQLSMEYIKLWINDMNIFL